MTPEEFAEKMREIIERAGTWQEWHHAELDELLCECLRSLGYGEGVALYDDTAKWYE